jgi:hypothetical protein
MIHVCYFLSNQFGACASPDKRDEAVRISFCFDNAFYLCHVCLSISTHMPCVFFSPQDGPGRSPAYAGARGRRRCQPSSPPAANSSFVMLSHSICT